MICKLLHIIFLSISILITGPVYRAYSQTGCPADVLPGKNEIKGWSQKKPSECFKGEDLYQAIDGAAEVYLEYGFTAMARTSYARRRRALDVEVYLMKDNEAAYGIMTSMNEGIPMKIESGRITAVNNYYGMMTGGRYFVIVTDPTGKGEIFRETEKIIDQISEKMQGECTVPEILDSYKLQGPAKVVLFNGDIVLNNHYYLGISRPFNYVKGVYFETAGGPLIVFKCNDDQPAVKTILPTLKKFSDSGKYSVDFENNTIINNKGDTLSIKSEGNLIIMSVKNPA